MSLDAARLASVGLAILLAAGCGPAGPRALVLGAESCAHCHMTIMDTRFSAQAITETGKVFVFDDVGCLASWLAASPPPMASLWVWSTIPGEGWLPAERAVYARSDTLRTPMRSGLAAVSPGAAADSLAAALGGTLIGWDEVRGAAHTHAPTGS
ncbi:MAG: nitrous oxide reductase accessory protein NosL [Gemmatimonadetes bacterium]|nr:nitrous oxide reductase accessory protein NosL [Gemmatimonadota bacterium]